MLKQCNATRFMVIPKALEFSLIYCYNVMYKAMPKLLCKRLKEMLPCLIN